MTALSILLITFCILMAGYYAGTETGFYRLNRVRLRFRVEGGNKRALRLDALVQRPEDFVITMLVGNNLFIYFATLICTRLYEPRYQTRAEIMAMLTLIIPIFLFGEVLQKEIFRHSADVLMYKMTRLVSISMRVFWPVVFLLKQLQHFWAFFLREKESELEMQMERQRLHHFFSEGAQEGMLSQYQHAMATNIIGLQEMKLARVMKPREAAITMHADHTLEECREVARNSPYHRFPVAAEDGTFLGVVNMIDVLLHRGGPFDLQEYLRPPTLLSADDNVVDALHHLKRSRQPMGFVKDASGKVVGIITIKDLVEEIVGELKEW